MFKDEKNLISTYKIGYLWDFLSLYYLVDRYYKNIIKI